ncbi:Uncharacterized protein BN1089_A1_04619 [Aneurinibacillus migulanus]|nr:Uncharacterized protein BN1089_A1_04619 [Aneurinibacillus migulanus]
MLSCADNKNAAPANVQTAGNGKCKDNFSAHGTLDQKKTSYWTLWLVFFLRQILFKLIKGPPEALLHGIEHPLKEVALFFSSIDRSAAKGYLGCTIIIAHRYLISDFERDQITEWRPDNVSCLIRKAVDPDNLLGSLDLLVHKFTPHSTATRSLHTVVEKSALTKIEMLYTYFKPFRPPPVLQVLCFSPYLEYKFAWRMNLTRYY